MLLQSCSTLILLIFAAVCACAATGHFHPAESAPFRPSLVSGVPCVQKTELHANWTLASTDPRAVESYPVRVPNTVVGALVELNAQRVQSREAPVFAFPDGDDPFYGKNLNAIPTENFTVPWRFSTDFTVPVVSSGKVGPYYVLQLNGINYAANVSLNGVGVADSQAVVGGVRRFLIDVDNGVLTNGTSNTLSITVSPPLDSWTTDLSFSFLDWAPFPADNSMGIWRDVSILELPRFRMSGAPAYDVSFFADGIAVHTLLPTEPAATGGAVYAYVTVSANIRCFPTNKCLGIYTADAALLLTVATSYPGLELLSAPVCNDTQFVVSEDGSSAEARFVWSWTEQPALVVQDPILWWPWEMGAQPLFDISVQCSGVNISEPQTFGLRQTTQAESSGGSLQLYVNNVPLLVRGGGWAPDLFYRISENTHGGNESRIQHQLELVKHMNLNTIRLEGKFEYKAFYEIASRIGLLVIPGMECCTSWQNWDQWTPAMTLIARLSVRDQIRRLSHYACNVAFLASSDELPPPAVERMYRDVIRKERWPNPIIAAASEQESPISGSTGVKMTGPYSWVPPVYWLQDVNGLELNFGGAWGFLTEGGPGEAPMTFESWNRTVPSNKLWNLTEGGSLSSWWNSHMGNPLGRFGTLRRFTPPLNARFGGSASAEEYCYKAQLQNYEGIRAMFEGYTKMKHHNATGVIQWMMNDAYPSHLWHLYDYYLVGGGGFYGAKAAGEPLHLLLSYVDGVVTLVNNRFSTAEGPFEIAANAYVVSPVLQRIYQSNTTALPVVPSDASLDLFSLDLTHLGSLAKKFSGGSNASGATPYLVQLVLSRVGSAATSEVASSWYILSTQMDVVNFSDSNGLWSNCSQWADFTALQQAPRARVAFADVVYADVPWMPARVSITSLIVNESPEALAMFIHVVAFCLDTGLELAPAFWSDNFFTLLPLANKTVTADVYRAGCSAIEVRAKSYTDVVPS